MAIGPCSTCAYWKNVAVQNGRDVGPCQLSPKVYLGDKQDPNYSYSWAQPLMFSDDACNDHS